MKISIITACFNASATLADTLASVRAQIHPDFELEHIVVDGGSSDGTIELLQSAAVSAQGMIFRYVSESDKGLYDAFNKGIRLATGDWVGILNADDVFDGDGVLAELARRIIETESAGQRLDGVYGDVRFVRELGGRTVRYCSGRHFRRWMFRFAAFPAHPSTFLRRELFERFGDYSLDYSICADFEMMLRLFFVHGIRTAYLPLCTTQMRLGGLSTGGLRANLEINRQDLRALRSHGIWSCLPLIYLKYFAKVWGYILKF